MQKTQTGSSRKLGLLSLAAATYFMVSGGPYGVEELVQDSGYKAALLILFVTPLLWALPTGLMVGELSAALPQEGGFYVWVRRAMGPFWGFQEAWLSLVASIFDMAIYPTLFVAYLGRLFPSLADGWQHYAIAGGLVLFCMLWNMMGAKAVGGSSVVVGALLLSPFVLITIFALARHATPVAVASTKADVYTALLVAMWNYMGWDNAATVANEVENPQKNYPRVMLLTLGAIMISYLLPVAAMWHMGIPLEAFSNGGWASIAGTVVGPFLVTVVVVTGMLTEFSSFNALVMSYSHLPVAMAEDGHLPKVFTRKLKSGAPWVAIIVLGIAWAASLSLPFDKLVMLDILLYGAGLLLEFAALIVLRVREPELPRPFRVPGGMPGAILVGVGPAALLVIAFIKNRGEHLILWRLGEVSQWSFGLALMALGVVYYFVAGRSSKVSSEA